MAGIYIHIPFCKTRCAYCDFFSTTQFQEKESYVASLCQEMALRTHYLPNPNIQTVYLGGGTPSQLSIQLLAKIFQNLEQYYDLSHCQEITLECNPDDICPEFLEGLQHLPVNRLSMGIQSFDEKELRLMNRRHTAQEAKEAVYLCNQYGYHNLSIDLIYGLPHQTQEIWASNLEQALALPITHLSAYHLTYEKGTVMYGYRDQAVSEDTSVLFYQMLLEATQKAGFEHYEISNFALPGKRAIHNSSYWKNTPYLGLGAGAHSYDLKSRQWNVASLKKYQDGIAQALLSPTENTLEAPYFEREVLSAKDHYNEVILTQLRTVEGIEKAAIDPAFQAHFEKEIQPYLEQGELQETATHVALTNKSWFISDGIICQLMA